MDATWATPATDGGSPITGYLVAYTDVTPQEDYRSGTATTDPRSHDWPALQLTPGDSYIFTVAAINAVGTGPASASTQPLLLYTTPGALTGLTVTPMDHAVVLSWVPPADDGFTPLWDYGVEYTDLTNPYGGGDGGYPGTAARTVVDDLVDGDTYTRYGLTIWGETVPSQLPAPLRHRQRLPDRRQRSA